MYVVYIYIYISSSCFLCRFDSLSPSLISVYEIFPKSFKTSQDFWDSHNLISIMVSLHVSSLNQKCQEFPNLSLPHLILRCMRIYNSGK